MGKKIQIENNKIRTKLKEEVEFLSNNELFRASIGVKTKAQAMKKLHSWGSHKDVEDMVIEYQRMTLAMVIDNESIQFTLDGENNGEVHTGKVVNTDVEEELAQVEWKHGKIWVRLIESGKWKAFLEDNEDGYTMPTTSNKVNTNTQQNKQTNNTNMKKATGATATIQTPAKTTATTSTVKATGTKAKGAVSGKTQPDFTIHSYQELAKMYGNGFVGKNKQTLIDELTARAVVGSN